MRIDEFASLVSPSPYPTAGASRADVQILGTPASVFLYRPLQRRPRGALILFDGMNRNAPSIRDKAIKLCEREALVAVAPLMDREQYPKWRYNWAGTFRNGVIQPHKHWIGSWIQALIEWSRDLVGRRAPSLYLFGHSAGGQLLSRVCAYSPPSGVDRILVSNSSVHVLPVLSERAPHGFKDILRGEDAVAALRNYLASPITVYLGQEDTGERNLSRCEASMRQGRNRLERGRFLFRLGEESASVLDCAFKWRLVEVPGVAHSARAMLEARQCSIALEVTRRV